MLGLVDFFGASFIVFIMSIAEMVAVFWIYGALTNPQVIQNAIMAFRR